MVPYSRPPTSTLTPKGGSNWGSPQNKASHLVAINLSLELCPGGGRQSKSFLLESSSVAFDWRTSLSSNSPSVCPNCPNSVPYWGTVLSCQNYYPVVTDGANICAEMLLTTLLTTTFGTNAALHFAYSRIAAIISLGEQQCSEYVAFR